MLDQLILYDTIYELAADEGRAEVLFGTCAPLAHKAFKRSLIGEGFPIVWFEVPLMGEPRFDLHVALSRETLRTGACFAPDTGNGYDELFRWYAEEEAGGRGLAFAYDVSEGRIDDPAVHVNVNRAPLSTMSRFFELAVGDDAAERYTGFARHLPRGWRIWYAGVHPGRTGSPVRIDCFVDPALKDAYAADGALLERDLRTCGFDAIGSALIDLTSPILEAPFALELQFDIMGKGALGSTLGISAGFPLSAADSVRKLFAENEPAAVLLGEIEQLGLSDERWQHIPNASFSKLVKLNDEVLALYCAPTFVKLRMRDGMPLDAKMYLQASATAIVQSSH